MRIPFIQLIKEKRILLLDGAWGTILQAEAEDAGENLEAWNLKWPERVKKIARAYIEAGSDIIETNTFRACRYNLRQYGLADKCYELNKAGAEISREAAGDEHWVLGSVGPSGTLLMSGEVSEDELYEDFRVQIMGLLDGGVDALCLETFFDLQEAAIAIEAARSSALPIICTFSFKNGFSMMGVRPEMYAEKMLELGVDVLGTNCGEGLSEMIDIVKRIRKVAPNHSILAQPNAGIPELRNMQLYYPEGPESMAAAVPEIIEAGANLIGGCCGSRPEHIRAMKEVIKNIQGGS